MKIIISGGGTAGHVYPGLSVALCLQKYKNIEIVFAGSFYGIENSIVPKYRFPLYRINVYPLNRVSFFRLIYSLTRLPFSILNSIFMILKIKPDIVIGCGGYVSGPVVFAAWLLRVPSAICEQNSVPGLTNRILSFFVKRVYGSFSASSIFFSKKKFRLTGNPVMECFRAKAASKVKKESKPRILILGGSLGSSFLNSVAPDMAKMAFDENLLLSIYHQTGERDFLKVQKIYDKYKIKAQVASFINDMKGAYCAADIVVCRAGASICFEVLSMGLVSIMVPYPHAAYDHQTKNAREIEKNKATILMRQENLTPLSLLNEIKDLIWNQEKMLNISKNALNMAKKEAASEIARNILNKFKD